MKNDTRANDELDDSIRAADADRERTADALREHHTAGRLTSEEFEERLERCMASTTLGDLRAVLRDLPGKRQDRAAAESRRRCGPPLWLLVPLAIVFGFAVASAGHAWHGGPRGGGDWHQHWFPWPLVLVLLVWLAFRWRARAACCR